MIDNYEKRFGFMYNPFRKDTNEFFIENENYKDIRENLEYVIETRGIATIVGSPGLGKTSSLRTYLKTLPSNKYKILYISLETLTVREFLSNLADKLGIVVPYKKNLLVKEIKESISTYYDTKKITPIIVLDEANYLSNAILNDIKILLNFEMDSKNKCVLILVGLPSLDATLQLGIHEPLNQRITAKVFLRELTNQESKIYFETKIEKAGGNLNMWEPQSVQALINAGNGIPRRIDRIADKTLMIADKMDVNVINSELVKKVVETL